MTVRVEYIYRYPVKGFRAERLKRGVLAAGAGLAWDRAFAFTSGNQPPPENNTDWTQARSFIQMTVYPQLAGFSAEVNETEGTLHIKSPDDSEATAGLSGGDDRAVNALMNQHFSPGPLGPIQLHRLADAHGHWDFSDTSISIINLATVEWLEWVSGLTLSHLRFRGNLYVTGLEPFEEFSLAGKTIRFGSVTMKVLRPALRCAATAADPWSGDTSIDVVNILRTYTGHAFCGMYAEVLSGGELFEDDHLRPVEADLFNPSGIMPERTPDPVLWPRPAVVQRTNLGDVSFKPEDASWPFIPANAGARATLHPGLDYTREPVRLILSERGDHEVMPVSGEALEELEDGFRVILSGPVERRSGRA
ncbi:MAG: MOSC N-terminal beta barrel domain-containing protein [Pseudomonadota bacterium]